MKIEEVWKRYNIEPMYVSPDINPSFICPSCGERIHSDDNRCPYCRYVFGGEFDDLPENFVPMLERPLWGSLSPDIGYESPTFHEVEPPVQRKLDEFIHQTNLDSFMRQNDHSH